MTLFPFMVSGIESSEGAFLVFHESRQQAKVYAWANCGEFRCVCDEVYFDVRARKLPKEPYIMNQREWPVPHIIVSPRTCRRCEMWGGRPISPIGNGNGCEFCEE